MEALSLYLFYAWVVVIHACFIGISAFAIWGNQLRKMATWKTGLLLLVPLIFLEFYWIPFAQYLDLTLHTKHPHVLNYFQLEPTTNIVDRFAPHWYHPFVFAAATLLAYRVGCWSYFKNQHINKKYNEYNKKFNPTQPFSAKYWGES